MPYWRHGYACFCELDSRHYASLFYFRLLVMGKFSVSLLNPFSRTRRGRVTYLPPSAGDAVKKSELQASTPDPATMTNDEKTDKARRKIIEQPVLKKSFTKLQIGGQIGLVVSKNMSQGRAWVSEVKASAPDLGPRAKALLAAMKSSGSSGQRTEGRLGPTVQVNVLGANRSAFNCQDLPSLPMLADKESWQFAHTQALTVSPDTRATPSTTDLGFYDLLCMEGALQTSNLHKLQALTVAMAPDPRWRGTEKRLAPVLDLSNNHRLEVLILHNWKKLTKFPPLSAHAPVRKVVVMHCRGGIDRFPAALGKSPHLEEIDWQGTPLHALPEGIFAWRKDIKIKLTASQVTPEVRAEIEAHQREDAGYAGPSFELIEKPPPEPQYQPSLESEVERWCERAVTDPMRLSIVHGKGVAPNAKRKLEQRFSQFLFNAIDILPRGETAVRMKELLFVMSKDWHVAIKCMQAACAADISDTDACAQALVAIEAAAKPGAEESNLERRSGDLSLEVQRWRAIAGRGEVELDFRKAGFQYERYKDTGTEAEHALAKFLFHAFEIKPQAECVERVNQMLDHMAEEPLALKACVVHASHIKDFKPEELEQDLAAMLLKAKQKASRNKGKKLGNFTSEVVRWLTPGSGVTLRIGFKKCPQGSLPLAKFLFDAQEIKPHESVAARINPLLLKMNSNPALVVRCVAIAAASTADSPQAHEATLQAMEAVVAEADAQAERAQRLEQMSELWTRISHGGNARELSAGQQVMGPLEMGSGDHVAQFAAQFANQVRDAEAHAHRILKMLKAAKSAVTKPSELIDWLDDIVSRVDVSHKQGFMDILQQLEDAVSSARDNKNIGRAYQQDFLGLYSPTTPSALPSSESDTDASSRRFDSENDGYSSDNYSDHEFLPG
jgi:hypothetical protein